jgi:hypothetical protein
VWAFNWGCERDDDEVCAVSLGLKLVLFLPTAAVDNSALCRRGMAGKRGNRSGDSDSAAGRQLALLTHRQNSPRPSVRADRWQLRSPFRG